MVMIKKQEISLMIQALRLQSYFPDSKYSIRLNTLVWKGHIQPTCLSPKYLIKVVYHRESNPNVYVLAPKPLTLAKGKRDLSMCITQKNNTCVYIIKGQKNGMSLNLLQIQLFLGQVNGYFIMKSGLPQVFGMVVEYIKTIKI